MANNRTHLEEKSKTLQQSRIEAERLEREMAMICSHSRPNKKGEMRFTLIPAEQGTYRCDQCGERFSLDPVRHEDLTKAVSIVHDVAQQVRAFSDPYTDEHFIAELGRADYNVKQLPKYYQRALAVYGKRSNGKGKKKSQNGFSSPF